MSPDLKILSVSLALLVPLWGDAQAQETEPAQEAPPSFPGEVEQVTVDVVVTDKEGIPITGLEPADLEVYEDGERQSIVSFDAFHVPFEASEAPAPRPRVSTNAVEQERRGRTFVMLFDDLHLTPRSALGGKQAVKKFLRDETREGDRVTLLSTGTGVWWTSRMEAGREELIQVAENLGDGIVPYTGIDRMSDYEAMQIHVNRDVAVMNRVQRRFETNGVVTGTFQGRHVRTLSPKEDPVITMRAAEVYYTATSRNKVTLGALVRSLDALVPVTGRKSLILVSDGFIYDKLLVEFREIVEAARRANTAIYFLSARGLEGMPMDMDADFSSALPSEDLGFAYAGAFEAAGGSESVAIDSGGFTIKNSNDLAGGLKRISDETRSYYLVGYNSTNTARDGEYRKISVKVPGRKDIKIRARRGYYAPSDEDGEKPRERSVFQVALDSPYDQDAIALRMTHVVRQETLLGKAHVFLATDIDVRDVAFEELEDGLATATLDLLLVATRRETGENFRYDQTMEMKLRSATWERLARSWMPFVREFELPSGGYQARIVVRDKATERVGTVTHEFEVPELEAFRVSTPVLSAVRETTEDGQPGDRLAIVARREFPRSGPLYCQFDVYGATRDETSGMPSVSTGFEVRRSDGTLIAEDAPSPITPTSLGMVSRLIGFSLEQATPGDYELLLSVKDDLSGETVELREPFSVSEPPPQAPPAPAPPATGSPSAR